jgi:cobalt transporter subunit CbtB
MQTAAVLNAAKTRVQTMAVSWPGIGVLMFGLVMLYSVGFSTFARTHNAAHDTPRLRTAAARNSAPVYARLIRPFGRVAVGETTDRKNAAGIRFAAIGTPARAIYFQNGESIASSTLRSMTTDRTR